MIEIFIIHFYIDSIYTGHHHFHQTSQDQIQQRLFPCLQLKLLQRHLLHFGQTLLHLPIKATVDCKTMHQATMYNFFS